MQTYQVQVQSLNDRHALATTRERLYPHVRDSAETPKSG